MLSTKDGLFMKMYLTADVRGPSPKRRALSGNSRSAYSRGRKITTSNKSK
jgi:hypothetical protein